MRSSDALEMEIWEQICGCLNETPRKSQNLELSTRRNKQVMGSPWALIITAWKVQTQCQAGISHELWVLWEPGTPCLCLVPLGILYFCWQQKARWFKMFVFLRAHLRLTTKYWVIAPLGFKLWWTFAQKWANHLPKQSFLPVWQHCVVQG